MDSNTASCQWTSQERYVSGYCFSLRATKTFDACLFCEQVCISCLIQIPACSRKEVACTVYLHICRSITPVDCYVKAQKDCQISSSRPVTIQVLYVVLTFTPLYRSSEMQSSGVTSSQWKRPSSYPRNGTGLLFLDSQRPRFCG